MLDISIWASWLSVRWQHNPRTRGVRTRDERGDITQTVIIVALFAAAAIAISAIIIAKFTAKASSIPTG